LAGVFLPVLLSVIVEASGIAADGVLDGLIKLLVTLTFQPCRQMPAVRQRKTHKPYRPATAGRYMRPDSPPNRIRLHIGVLGLENFFCPLNGERLNKVGYLLAFIVAFAG